MGEPTARPADIILSLGGNQGPVRHLLRQAVAHYGARVRAVSDLYATAPWGGVEQPDFLNICLRVGAAGASLVELLDEAQALEVAAHRTREVRWGPRTLDVDIIAATDAAGQPLRCTSERLTVPHPRAHLRAFVLLPWLDVEPDAQLLGEPLAAHVQRLDPTDVDGVRRLVTAPTWLEED